MKKLTTKEFIEKAKIVHGDEYDYSLVVYIRSRADEQFGDEKFEIIKEF